MAPWLKPRPLAEAPPPLCCAAPAEHQAGEGVAPQVHEDLHRHPQEAQGTQQVRPVNHQAPPTEGRRGGDGVVATADLHSLSPPAGGASLPCRTSTSCKYHTAGRPLLGAGEHSTQQGGPWSTTTRCQRCVLLCVAPCWVPDSLPPAGSCAAAVRPSCGTGSPVCSAPRSDPPPH